MFAVRIATWNVNSLRSRIDRVEALLQRHDIDVLALQETKAREDQLPLMGLQSLGYDVVAAGTSQYSDSSRARPAQRRAGPRSERQAVRSVRRRYSR